jgi:hypothetical protein
MVLAQRPHWGLQPKQPNTSPALCGAAGLPVNVPRISWSLITLQEQTIMVGSIDFVSFVRIPHITEA